MATQVARTVRVVKVFMLQMRLTVVVDHQDAELLAHPTQSVHRAMVSQQNASLKDRRSLRRTYLAKLND